MNYEDIIRDGKKKIAEIEIAFFDDKITREEMERKIRDIEYELAECERDMREEEMKIEYNY